MTIILSLVAEIEELRRRKAELAQSSVADEMRNPRRIYDK
jgi:hypothetical protein